MSFKRALEIIRDNEITMPKEFAYHYFPEDHEGWHRHGRVGRGTTHGVGLVLFAGGLLGKLRARGFINGGSREWPYRLTDEGKEFLNKKGEDENAAAS